MRFKMDTIKYVIFAELIQHNFSNFSNFGDEFTPFNFRSPLFSMPNLLPLIFAPPQISVPNSLPLILAP